MQHNENANPPTFFLTLDSLVQKMSRDGQMVRRRGRGKRGGGIEVIKFLLLFYRICCT